MSTFGSFTTSPVNASTVADERYGAAVPSNVPLADIRSSVPFFNPPRPTPAKFNDTGDHHSTKYYVGLRASNMGVPEMYDYSLESVDSRPAKVDENYHTELCTCTRGFAAAEDAKVAVCVLPGTELRFPAR